MQNIATGCLGIFAFMLLAWILSSKRHEIRFGTIGIALLFEFLLAVPVFLFPQSRSCLLIFSSGFMKLLEASREGIVFVFGSLGAADSPQGFILIFQSLTFIIVFSALFSFLYYLRVLPFVIVTIARFVQKVFGISSVEAICSAGNLFVGIESFAAIRPYMSKLTRSELFLVFTVFMSTVASSVMALYVSILNPVFPTIAGHLVSASVLSIPAAVMIAKLMEPETESRKIEELKMEIPESARTFAGSIISGASDGGKMVFGIAVLLIAVVGLLGILNMILSSCFGEGVKTGNLLGYVFYPFTWFMGVEVRDIPAVSELLGMRLAMTEVPSYIKLGSLLRAESLSPRSGMIAAYALCGFTSIESLGIATGAFVALAPEKAELISKLFFRILLAATLTTLMTGTVAGIFFRSGPL